MKAQRWVVDWIKGHYPDKDVQILECDVHTDRATICVKIDGDHMMDVVPGRPEGVVII